MRAILTQATKPIIALGILAFTALIFMVSTGSWGELIGWIYTQQQALHQQLITALRTLRAADTWLAAGPLIAISFFYGLFHAAGPGHGKVIISTYLLANRDDVPRGLSLAFLAALLQGIVAISLIYGLVFLFDFVPRDTKFAVSWTERLGFSLVIILGLMLIYRAWRAFKAEASHQHHIHHHKHDHDHKATCNTCGHAHAPQIEQIRAARDWRSSLAIIFSIGLRPCTGAILVLVFAIVTKQFWAGIASVFAMSLGTAIAISALAILTISMREAASRLYQTSGRQRLAWVSPAITLIGGLLLVVIGSSLFQASFQMRGSFGL